MLSEDETIEAFTEVLNHVVTLRLSVDQEVKTNLLLEVNDGLNLLLDELLVLLLRDLLLSELGTSLTDLLSLLQNGACSVRIKINSCSGLLTGKDPMVVVGNLGRLRTF